MTFSPKQLQCKKVTKSYKVPNAGTLRTLNVEALYNYVAKCKERRLKNVTEDTLLIPDSDVDEATWKNIRLIRVDHTSRKVVRLVYCNIEFNVRQFVCLYL